MILLVTIASSFVDRDRSVTEVVAYMESYVPIGGEMQRHIRDAIVFVIRAREQAGAVALLILVWAALECVTILVCATSRAWNTEVYSWWRLPLKSLVLLGVTTGCDPPGHGGAVLAKMAKDWVFPVNDFRSWVSPLGGFVIPLFVVFLSLSLFSRLTPPAHAVCRGLGRRPVRRSGRRAFSAGGNNDGTDHEELNPRQHQ
jgi:uncharacterized BrkB/YihY/UPF0761 family membrane protein